MNAEKRRLYIRLVFSIMLLGIATIFVIVWKIHGKDNNFKSQFSTELSLSTLNEKTGEECIAILKKHGLVLPEVYENDKQLAQEAVKTIISDLNNKTMSSGAVPYSYTEMAELTERISDIIFAEVN